MSWDASNRKMETAGVIRYSCGILFMFFSFCYLYFLKGEVLAQAQYVTSNGLTHYSILAGAVIITVVLQIVQWVAGKLSSLPASIHSLSYLPSALALAFISDLDEERILNSSYTGWAIGSAVVLVLYVILVILGREFLSRPYDAFEYDTKRSIYPNYIILLAIIIGVGIVPRATDVTHYELKTERLILEKDYQGASEVAPRALRTSPRLTQLRMYALSKQGLLPEKLFCYPQLYGSTGLLDISDTLSTHRFPTQSICLHLGAFCGKNIATTQRYLQLMVQSDSMRNRHTIDYYLCSLLLDKKLKEFSRNLPLYYNLSDTLPDAYNALPRYYREALIQIADKEKLASNVLFIHGDSLTTLTDTAMVSQYFAYAAQKREYTKERERINRTHRSFGKTFWWYYDFSDKANGELQTIKTF